MKKCKKCESPMVYLFGNADVLPTSHPYEAGVWDKAKVSNLFVKVSVYYCETCKATEGDKMHIHSHLENVDRKLFFGK